MRRGPAKDRGWCERLSKTQKAFGCVLVLALLASITLNVYLYLQMRAVQENSPLSCFQCDEIEGYPVDWNKVQRQPEDSNLCCMQTEDFLKGLKVPFSTAKQERATVPMPSRENGAVSDTGWSVNLTLPALFICGSEVHNCTITSEISAWQTGTIGHVRGNLAVESGRIMVKSTGIYHVYSQVSYCESSSGSTFIRLSIVRDNPSLHVVAEVLLSTETTRCKDLPGQQRSAGDSSSPTSCYLGAEFELFRDDEVYVKASCIGNLKSASAATYFGMYLVETRPRHTTTQTDHVILS